MTILSAAIGNVLPNLLPRKYTHYASAVRMLLLLSQGSYIDSDTKVDLDDMDCSRALVRKQRA